jgi:hypothetical protein
MFPVVKSNIGIGFIIYKTIENQIGKALKILRTELADYLPILVWLGLTDYL